MLSRDGLGFEGERDLAVEQEAAARFNEFRSGCDCYIRGALQTAVASRIDELAVDCRIGLDGGDVDVETLVIECPTLLPSGGVAYVAPHVKTEAGARSALGSIQDWGGAPDIADDLLG